MHTAPSPSSVHVSAPAAPPPVGPCRIGPHRFDPEQCEIEREGEWLPLQRQPCRVLAYLVEHRDRFVSKQELHDAAWPDSVVSDAALASAMRDVRRALGDDGREQRLIRTRRGLGYRLVAPVEIGVHAVSPECEGARARAGRGGRAGSNGGWPGSPTIKGVARADSGSRRSCAALRANGSRAHGSDVAMASQDRTPKPAPVLHGPAWLRALDADDEMRQFLDHVRAVVTEMDEDRRIVYVNSTIRRVSGYRPEEIIGMKGSDLIHPDDLKVIEELRNLGPVDLSPHHLYRTRRKDGTWAWCETAFAKDFEVADGSLHRITFARDVTDLVEAGARVRESEERYRRVVETSSEMISETNLDGNLLFVDGKTAELLGYGVDELQQLPGFSLIHPDDAQRVRESFETALDSHSLVTIEPYRIRRRDERWLWVTGRSIAYGAFDGEQRFLNVMRDITAEIERERAQREFDQRTEQARRLESLGVMAGGIAHDFSNLLTPILGEANLAIADLPEDSPVRNRLERIARSARRAADLTKQMLAYAGADAVEREVLQLSSLVDEVPGLIEAVVSPRIAIDYERVEELAPVEANPAQLLQVAMNLVANAAEAVGDGPGTIHIRTGRVDLRDGVRHDFSYGSLEPGEYAYMEVEDDGCGMDAETRARIFDPFFTTKFTGRGLGLAAVLGIVRAHGGALDLESEVGRGSRFRVLLPIHRGAAPARPAPSPMPETQGLSGTILVVDDDDAVVEVASETLRRIGFEVLGTTDAAEAIELYRKHAADVRLVLLDRAMPGVPGDALLRALREIRADARVLLISGYSESRLASELADEPLAGFLQKPFLPEGLIEKVRALLV